VSLVLDELEVIEIVLFAADVMDADPVLEEAVSDVVILMALAIR
jgi:hypothetical protein